MKIGDRMKEYENVNRIKLTRRIPVIMRLDGRAFHTLTKKCEKPFDDKFIDSMIYASQELCKDIHGAKFAYIQSDEVSILITDFDKYDTAGWFNYNIQKMTSLAASLMSVSFSYKFGMKGLFDCRVSNYPHFEVINYFKWRQIDWNRNSLNMVARKYYSHAELKYKKNSDKHEMIFKAGDNWAKYDDVYKNGTFISKDNNWNVHHKCPIFNYDDEIFTLDPFTKV